MHELVYAELALAVLVCCFMSCFVIRKHRFDENSESAPLILRKSASKDESEALQSSMGTFKTFMDKPTRAFVIVRHPSKGYLLLKAFKKRKGEHYQLPGGRIDKNDESPKFAAARELYEETGIDLRCQLSRLSVVFKGETWGSGRLYFVAQITDEEVRKVENYFAEGESSEHIGYAFVEDLSRAQDLVALHSGGKSRYALRRMQELRENSV